MSTSEIELLKNFSLLQTSERKSVLNYIKSLLKSKSTSKSTLAKFVGILSKQEADEMKKNIAAGCENIDKNEW